MSKIHYENEKNREMYPKYFQTYELVQEKTVREKILNRSHKEV